MHWDVFYSHIGNELVEFPSLTPSTTSFSCPFPFVFPPDAIKIINNAPKLELLLDFICTNSSQTLLFCSKLVTWRIYVSNGNTTALFPSYRFDTSKQSLFHTHNSPPAELTAGLKKKSTSLSPLQSHKLVCMLFYL